MADDRARTDCPPAPAYHEAGHAVVGAILGRELVETTIEPVGLAVGRTRWGAERAFDNSADGRLRATRDIIMRLAGRQAEERATGQDGRQQADDDYLKVSFASEAAGLHDGPGTHAESILVAFGETMANLLVFRWWEAIEAAAIELADRGTLDAARVREIISEYPPR